MTSLGLLWGGIKPVPYSGYGRVLYGIMRVMRENNIPYVTPCDYDFEDADTVLVIGSPSVPFQQQLKRKPKRLYLYTMTESALISEYWVHLINTYYDGVFVPEPPLIDVFKNSGVEKPVYAAPIGLNYAAPEFRSRLPSDPFRFVTYTYGGKRKGGELAMLTFARLFNGDPRFELIIKARDEAAWLRSFHHPQMRMVFDLSHEEWLDLLYSAHCFVFPSRGEGRGLPPIEATLSGCPTITTQWLGSHDADKWASAIVRSKGTSKAHFTFWEANRKGAEWNEPDIESLYEQMRWVVDHYVEAVKRTEIGSVYLRSITWNQTLSVLKGILL